MIAFVGSGVVIGIVVRPGGGVPGGGDSVTPADSGVILRMGTVFAVSAFSSDGRLAPFLLTGMVGAGVATSAGTLSHRPGGLRLGRGARGHLGGRRKAGRGLRRGRLRHGGGAPGQRRGLVLERLGQRGTRHFLGGLRERRGGADALGGGHALGRPARGRRGGDRTERLGLNLPGGIQCVRRAGGWRAQVDGSWPWRDFAQDRDFCSGATQAAARRGLRNQIQPRAQAQARQALAQRSAQGRQKWSRTQPALPRARPPAGAGPRAG